MSVVATGPAAGLPRWAVLGLLPALSLLAAFAVSGLIVVLIGESPWEAVRILLWGAFGFQEAIGYTLFYATSFIFTGLAVAVAFHCGLFNIGGEGQAYIGGLGMALVCLYLDFLPFGLIVPAAVVGPRCSAPPGRLSPRGCRRTGAATSSSPPSCSISSPPR